MNAFNQAGLTAGQLEHLPKSATEFDILNSIPDSKVPHIIRGDSDRVYVLEKRWVSGK